MQEFPAESKNLLEEHKMHFKLLKHLTQSVINLEHN